MLCSPSLLCNPCGCKDNCTIKWADLQVNNPTTDSQTAKYIEAMCKDANPPNLMHLLLAWPVNRICHHINIVNLLLPFMLTIVHTHLIVIAFLLATPMAALAATTAIKRTAPNTACLVHAATATLLAIVTFYPMQSIWTIIQSDMNYHSLPTVYALGLVHILMVLTIWKCSPIQTKKLSSCKFWQLQTLRTPLSFIRWIAFSKKLNLLLIRIIIPAINPILATNLQWTCSQHNYAAQETKEYSCWYHAKPEKPPSKLKYDHDAQYSQIEADLLAKENNFQSLQKHDCRCYKFLQGTSKTYYNLLLQMNLTFLISTKTKSSFLTD